MAWLKAWRNGAAWACLAAAAAGQGALCTPPTGAVLWSSYSWNGGVAPTAGACVTIASGTTVFLDVTPPPLTSLVIDGSLVFDCRNLTLTSAYILVRGTLEVGSAAAPFANTATIVLTKTPTSPACTTIPEDQTLAVEDTGVLRLIGASRGLSWDRLASTATPPTPPATSTLALQNAPGWTAGDAIVVASTDFDAAQAETAVVASTTGASVALTTGLAETHWGATEAAHVDGTGLEERAEVGLLSRWIVVTGTPTASANGGLDSGHVILRLSSPTVTTQPRAEVENVEFRDLGKEGILGKYPLHIHEIGDVNYACWIKNSSIHRSVNRAISIHNSSRVLVEDNVAYDVVGHAYYIEDDPVRGCELRRNLGLRTKAAVPGREVQASDLAPATFWLRHPDNVLEDNVAAGSDGYGFWLEPLDGETTPPTLFSGNVAHSNGLTGFHQDTRATPATTALFTDLVAYKNRGYGIWLRSYDSSVIQNAAVADNRAGFYLASEAYQFSVLDYFTLARPLGLSITAVVDSLVVGETTNLGKPTTALEMAAGRSLPSQGSEPLTGVELYDGFWGVVNTAFGEFPDLTLTSPSYFRPGVPFTQIPSPTVWGVDPRNLVSGVSFVNVARRLGLRPSFGAVTYTSGSLSAVIGDHGTANSMLLDLDGSLTGTAGSWAFPHSPLSPDGNFLVPATGWSVNTSWNAVVTSGPPARPYAQLQFDGLNVAFNAYFMTSFADPSGIQVTATAGSRSISLPGLATAVPPPPATTTHFEYFPHFATNLFADESYDVTWMSIPNTPTPAPKFFMVTLQSTEPGRWVIVSVPLPPPTSSSTWFVHVDTVPANAQSSLAALQAGPGNEFFDDTGAGGTGKLYLKILTGNAGLTGFPAILNGTRSTFAVGWW